MMYSLSIMSKAMKASSELPEFDVGARLRQIREQHRSSHRQAMITLVKILLQIAAIERQPDGSSLR